MTKIEQQPVQTDVDLFLKVFAFPVRPQKVRWQVIALGNPKNSDDPFPGPTDYKRLATLEFEQKDLLFLTRLKQSKEIYSVSDLNENWMAEWYSPEIKRQMEKAFQGKDEIEVTSYSLSDSSIASSGTMIKITEVDAYLLTAVTH